MAASDCALSTNSCKRISIFGVTGSIGQSTCDVIESAPEAFDVYAVTAHKNVKGLVEAARRLKAKMAVIADESLLPDLKLALSNDDIEAHGGERALIEAAKEPVDLVMAAIVGMAGLRPMLEAVRSAHSVAIANKEPLVAAGPLVITEAERSGCRILPVDSEHNAIFQVFEDHNRDAIERLILTASGGPFRSWPLSKMRKATPDQAVAHPNWSMGAKISVDSASMMNKALEVIEAHYLFDMPPEKIDVLVHPQSVVHSMVEYNDGSFLAQMGASDMRTPIAYALAYPHRTATPGQKLDLRKLGQLSFEEPDMQRFPALPRAYDCLSQGQAACLAFNAANEVAVEAFLAKLIGFLDIMSLIDHILQTVEFPVLGGLDDILAFDQEIRKKARAHCLSGMLGEKTTMWPFQRKNTG